MKTPILIALLIACALPARADIVFGNLASFNNDSGPASNISSAGGKAIGFTMGDTAYEITGVSLRLAFAGDNGQDVPKITIWTNASDTPGTQIGDAFLNPALNPNPATYSFTPAGTITLEANTGYFLVLQNGTATASFDWLNGSPTVTPTGIAGTAIGRYGSDSPSSYADSTSNYNWFQIDGVIASTIPEPSTYAALLGTGVLGWVAVRRRQRR